MVKMFVIECSESPYFQPRKMAIVYFDMLKEAAPIKYL